MKFVAALALVASMTIAMETEQYNLGRRGYDLGRGRGGYGYPLDSRRVGRISGLRSHGRLSGHRDLGRISGHRDLGRQYGRGGYGSRSYRPAYEAPKETTYAKCMLKDPEEENYLGGTINMRQDGYGDVWIWGDVWGVEPGKHGFHVHELGDLRQGCKSLAGHYNGVGDSYNQQEKIPGKRFIGDLKSVIANKSGDARVDQRDSALTLVGPESIIGRSLVFHGLVPKGKGGNSYGNDN